MAKTLDSLLSVLERYEVNADKTFLIKGITDDSRKVQEGFIFICLSGYHVNGYDYILSAYKKGAAAILVDKDVDNVPSDLIVIKVPDVKIAMQKIVPAFFDYPAKKMTIVGITGTNGKTTTSYMLQKIAKAAGKKTGVIGTMGALIEETNLPVANTTPDVVGLQTILNQMQEQQVEYVFMEVSSHALSLNRVAGIEFDIAVLTNITQDHLDFHKTFDAYVKAKSLLFESLNNNKTKLGQAIINNDDKSSGEIISATNVNVITYGKKTSSDIYPLEVEMLAQSTKLLLNTPQGKLDLFLLTTGYFNVYNVMAAVATSLALGFSLDIIYKSLEGFAGVDGRFELVNAGQPFTVVVDYAHTPDSLQNVLNSAREIAEGKVIVVFGCGGDRDKTKRPLMGEIAEKSSDYVYITSDNPRSEVPEAIIEDIRQGIKNYDKCQFIIDRHEAIEKALLNAKDGDIVIIAGKGHETYQILHDKTIDFDDRKVAREFLEGKFNA